MITTKTTKTTSAVAIGFGIIVIPVAVDAIKAALLMLVLSQLHLWYGVVPPFGFGLLFVGIIFLRVFIDGITGRDVKGK